HRALRYEQRTFLDAGLDTDTAVQTRAQDIPGVWKRRDQTDRARVDIHLAIGPENSAFVRVDSSVSQNQLRCALKQIDRLSAGAYALGTQILLLADWEIYFDWIHLRDRSEVDGRSN